MGENLEIRWDKIKLYWSQEGTCCTAEAQEEEQIGTRYRWIEKTYRKKR